MQGEAKKTILFLTHYSLDLGRKLVCERDGPSFGGKESKRDNRDDFDSDIKHEGALASFLKRDFWETYRKWDPRILPVK